jgi:hypothetical protein
MMFLTLKIIREAPDVIKYAIVKKFKGLNINDVLNLPKKM